MIDPRKAYKALGTCFALKHNTFISIFSGIATYCTHNNMKSALLAVAALAPAISAQANLYQQC
jgi:hypothetical protein